MAILNVTPDSFSDGGRYMSVDDAVRRANQFIGDGANIIDIGGESTRPGATKVSWQEEWSRISDVIRGVSKSDVLLSVDTYHVETAERAADLGVSIINCVYEEYVPAILTLKERFEDLKFVVPSKCISLVRERGFLEDAYIDPMIGFGTTREEDIELLKSIPQLSKMAKTLIGVSRKRIVKHLATQKYAFDAASSVALALWAVMQGASCVRVHDVRETCAALKTISSL